MSCKETCLGGLFQSDGINVQNPFDLNANQPGYTPETDYQLSTRLGLKNVAEGGKLSYGHGGEVMETEGEFNHSTNKKALVDEESGVKEAELTGGELVFNPDQTQMMEELISSGDAKKLMAFLKDLMSQPQFQA